MSYLVAYRMQPDLTQQAPAPPWLTQLLQMAETRDDQNCYSLIAVVNLLLTTLIKYQDRMPRVIWLHML